MYNKIGFIGCGSVVQKNYFEAFKQLADSKYELYFFDLRSELSNQVAGKLKGSVLSDQEDLIYKSDIVIVATPPSSHYNIVSAVLNNGKAVICEKPFMKTYSEAKSILEIQNRVNKKVFVGHFRRTFAQVQKAREIIKTGILGRLKKIRLYEGGRFNWSAESNYVTKDPFGGVLFDTGSHTFDTALFISGIDESEDITMSGVNVLADKSEPSHEIKGNFSLSSTEFDYIEFEFMLSRYKVLSNKIEIIGEKGKLTISTALNPRLIIESKLGNVILIAENALSDYMQYFTKQIQDIFAVGPESNKFNAARFLNLTYVLENLAKSNKANK